MGETTEENFTVQNGGREPIQPTEPPIELENGDIGLSTVRDSEADNFSIRDFSYIWSPRGFDLDGLREPQNKGDSGGEDEADQQQYAPPNYTDSLKGGCLKAYPGIDSIIEAIVYSSTAVSDEQHPSFRSLDFPAEELPTADYRSGASIAPFEQSAPRPQDTSEPFYPSPPYPTDNVSASSQCNIANANDASRHPNDSIRYRGESDCGSRDNNEEIPQRNSRQEDDNHPYGGGSRLFLRSPLFTPPHTAKAPRLLSRIKSLLPSRQRKSRPHPPIINPTPLHRSATRSSWSKRAKRYLNITPTTEKRELTATDGLGQIADPQTISNIHAESAIAAHSDSSWGSSSSLTFNEGIPTPLCPDRPLSIADYEKINLLDVDIGVLSGCTPQPFQCTFCLVACEAPSQWIQHERDIHLADYDVAEMPVGLDDPWDGLETPFSPVDTASLDNSYSRSCGDEMTTMAGSDSNEATLRGESHSSEASQSTSGRKQQRISTHKWFWNCGFCEILLKSWGERQEHIIQHFEEGITMSSWDPLRPPYPLSKFSLIPVAGFPRWNPAPLLAMQHSLQDCIDRVGDSEQHWCKDCEIRFNDLDSYKQHTELWHLSRDRWRCPGVEHATTPGVFYEPSNGLDTISLQDHEESLHEGPTDLCLCCGKTFPNDTEDWQKRLQHLREEHRFEGQKRGEKFFREEQFLLHLANSHNVDFDYVSELASLCRQVDRAPVLMIS
ncbi:hypothetical protein AJ80_05259 [Polytolypa hystricis UAMH7299]|uniref:C2H2-type domain-containing protein n=1 Tax=Polytolypa hystricis (strain UAMH7299) TaxID=1447883 RepID=A0A2B7Y421_POLH7|nr:hypothetical protein AJ80_05259 [Polytolypa hystricis UAMH7299]